MEAKLKRGLESSDADYTEIHWEETKRTSVDYTGKELEGIGTQTQFGGNVRAYYQGGWGFVSFNDLARLRDHVRVACLQARLGKKGGGNWVTLEGINDRSLIELEDDPRKVPLAEKERVCRLYNDILLRSPLVQTSRVRYEDTFLRRIFCNSEGSWIEEERIYTGIAFYAYAKEGSNVQMAFDSIGGRRGYSTVLGLEEKVEKVAKEAVDLLKAEKIEGGRYTVIADPKLAGVFAHEAFGHLSEADFVFQNEELKKIMKLGERFGPDELSIVDDGTIKGERGHYKYDDEGVAARKNYLIKDGILVGRLHSRETAMKMGESPTGNARCINYRFQPIVRMSCTYIEPKNWSFEEMLRDTDYGIYAQDSLGGMTELEMFTFSAAKAYLIKKGKLDRMLRDVILSGNVFQTLKNIDAIGNDLTLFGGLGGCGKGEQYPLPISDGSPHIRMRDVVIGGR